MLIIRLENYANPSFLKIWQRRSAFYNFGTRWGQQTIFVLIWREGKSESGAKNANHSLFIKFFTFWGFVFLVSICIIFSFSFLCFWKVYKDYSAHHLQAGGLFWDRNSTISSQANKGKFFLFTKNGQQNDIVFLSLSFSEDLLIKSNWLTHNSGLSSRLFQSEKKTSNMGYFSVTLFSI